ncbi:uncharacterized protein BcabD6B2_04860 [Babesia caballi]|uniref:Membrane protein, putative n=1 Tax=Babesia caballi TaxID=5871 RepID=A0AAV4LM14_BABCB|nr:membrane protein, putative [Babesia caballi]
MYGPERRSRTRWCEQLVLLHHVLSLCFWVSVELLLLTFFLRHEEGKWLSLDTIANTNPAALWNYVRPFFQCGLVAQALVSVYALVASDPSCSRRLIAVERCIRVCTVYFVALPVVRDSVSLRSLLIPVSGWTLLNILRCLNTLYGSKGSFEWLSNKGGLRRARLTRLSVPPALPPGGLRGDQPGAVRRARPAHDPARARVPQQHAQRLQLRGGRLRGLLRVALLDVPLLRAGLLQQGGQRQAQRLLGSTTAKPLMCTLVSVRVRLLRHAQPAELLGEALERRVSRGRLLVALRAVEKPLEPLRVPLPAFRREVAVVSRAPLALVRHELAYFVDDLVQRRAVGAPEEALGQLFQALLPLLEEVAANVALHRVLEVIGVAAQRDVGLRGHPVHPQVVDLDRIRVEVHVRPHSARLQIHLQITARLPVALVLFAAFRRRAAEGQHEELHAVVLDRLLAVGNGHPVVPDHEPPLSHEVAHVRVQRQRDVHPDHVLPL